jgi:methylenetetrahydrofolate dehydrogenase (NADP+)/methenyltetrahydrofolate cyclohydrolase
MESVEHKLPAETSQDELLELIDRLNRDDAVDGILVQLPLPPQIDPNVIAEATDAAKDADGIHPLNSGRMLAGTADLMPCTPLGIMEVLDRYGVELEGAHAVVIGRSDIVGKPVSILLQQRNATVTMCHSRTRDLPSVCRQADVLVAATGRPRMVKADWVRPGAAVIDVGVSEVDGKLVGDVDFDAVLGIASLITPSRRGIGPMTITMLLRNTLHAYRARTGRAGRR